MRGLTDGNDDDTGLRLDARDVRSVQYIHFGACGSRQRAGTVEVFRRCKREEEGSGRGYGGRFFYSCGA